MRTTVGRTLGLASRARGLATGRARWRAQWASGAHVGAELVKVDLRDTIGVDDNGRFRLPGINPR